MPRSSASAALLTEVCGKGGQAYGRQKGIEQPEVSRPLRSLRGHRVEDKRLRIRKSVWDEDARPGVIKAAGKGSIQPSARGVFRNLLRTLGPPPSPAYSRAALLLLHFRL